MSQNYDIVPWFNSQEWYRVYEELSSENPIKQDALNLLEMWKARCPSLPSGIESTLSLLQVYVQDIKTGDDDVSNEPTLRLAYSSAIMRFVNHMLDAETARGLSLYSAAKNAGVPDWIVELRHDAAHSHNIPSINLLRSACTICLQWLREHYWEHHNVLGIHDYCNNIDENKIATMIYFCSCISICAHSKIKKITDIPETKMQNSIINDAKVLFSDYDSLNYGTLTIATIIDLMNSNAKRIFKDSGSTYYVNKALVHDQSLILSLELLDYLSEKDFNEKNKLNRSFVSSFEVLLTFLHTNDLILDFIMVLVKITQTDNSQRFSKLAALWISEILVALKKSKQFLERARRINSASAASNQKKSLKQLYHHWFPNEKHEGLVLDLQKAVPRQLTDINFIQPIMSTYSPYVTYFVKDLLNLLDPCLPKPVSNRICNLAKLISTPEHFPADLSLMKIYTIEDVNSETMIVDENDDITKSGANDSITEVSSGIWRIASNHYNWRTCPIGKLPQTEELDVEME